MDSEQIEVLEARLNALQQVVKLLVMASPQLQGVLHQKDPDFRGRILTMPMPDHQMEAALAVLEDVLQVVPAKTPPSP